MRHAVLTRLAVGSCLLGGLGESGLTAQQPATFVRGDLNQNGRLEVTDAIIVLRFLFAGEREPVTCEDAADIDDDGQLAVTDPVALLDGLFRGGPAPPAPFRDCGADPTPDALGCRAYEICGFAFTFFGVDFAADGVFFVIDRSGSMSGSGELARAKGETLGVVRGMPQETRFGIIFFDRGVLKFPASGTPAEANTEMKMAGESFVAGVPGGSGTCGREALHAALDYADASAAQRNEILYVSDGGGTCAGEDEASYLARTLAEVTSRNGGRARIHTFCVLGPFLPGSEFLKQLAEQNRGTFFCQPP
jgi:hypothetical protein